MNKLGDQYGALRYKVQKKAVGRWLASGLVLLFVFALGLGIGDGRIRLRAHPVASYQGSLDYSGVNDVYNTLVSNYDGKLDKSQLLEGLKKGLATATNDPYTEYFTPEEAKEFTAQLNNSFSGIGAELGQDSEKNLIVVAPIAGTPAARAGLKPQDIITTVNDESTTNMSIDEAVSKIRGKKGTKVTLKTVRNKSEALTFTITRDDIQVPSVTTKILDGNIGYMQISTFADDTADLARKAAHEFKNKHVKSIILDLRANPGGLVDQAVGVSSLWLPEGKFIMQEKRASGEVMNTYTAEGGDILNSIRTVVLVNGGTASASEITAGALRDNGAATIMGEKTYGKGVVQAIENFRDGSELKVTIASWYRPNGQNINHKGITPDHEVKLSDKDSAAGNDTQKAAAIEYLKK